ncbi:hypothetical protein L1987_83980 [Smallanthus sonchifolius]|uniref:Uncharacterized protein n=1 Tax=Smallanthus sonchifolius TaxID=185202 RepID=A0ACB8YDJ1_9ASTR|nr:hypothetical protein L1987_83980 [Smallanthus sonchifolius]
MGRGRGKGKKFTLTNNDDTGNGEEERIPAQKRRGRPQKVSGDEIDDDIEKIEDEENTKVNDVVSNKDGKVIEDGKKRKRNKQVKEEGNLVKEESGDGSQSNTNGSTQVNGFRHMGSRRKSKPRRAAEAGVECK